MDKTRGGIIKQSGSNASKNKKRKAEQVSKALKKKKFIVEEHESNFDSDTMAEIDNYQDNESSRDTQTGDEDEDPLSLPICAKDISDFKLNKEQKLKCLLVLFVHTMLLSDDRSKIVDSSHIKMKQSQVFNERENASYALYDILWAFLDGIYEAFPHLGKYAKKSLDSPLPIFRLLRWYTAKNDNIIEGDPFKYKGKSTKVVHPYFIPTVRETKKNYLTTLKPYVDEVKDTILDALKANLKGVIVRTSAVENVEDEYLSYHNPNQPCENYVPSTSKDETTNLAVDDDNFSAPTVDDEILPLAIVDDDLVVVDEYFAKEVDEVVEEMKEEEKDQDEEKMTSKEEEKLEEKKEEESDKEKLEEKKNEENEASGEEDKEQQEEKITEDEEKEKVEEESLATDATKMEKEVDVMDIMIELNVDVGGDE
ncbi:protein KRI1-like [Solanum verrucosum]|uniref:protein KRI1-like n=1 Tax=Solanum verrucosum TaxID=315347 RepID=UPI0020D1B142|nr:protein KRI1-like [Solanum verrucosum]